MGIANTTASAALIAAFTGASPAQVTGYGTGIDEQTYAHKVDVVRRALDLHRRHGHREHHGERRADRRVHRRLAGPGHRVRDRHRRADLRAQGGRRAPGAGPAPATWASRTPRRAPR